MFLGGLKEKSARRAIEKSISGRVRSRTTAHSFDLEQPLTIGLLIEEDQQLMADLNRLLQKTFHLKTELRTIHYTETWSKEKQQEDDVIHQARIGWKGVLKHASLKSFVDTAFDLLICFYQDQNMALDLLASKSKARLVVGIKEDDLGLFDLVIYTRKGEENVFVKELYTYLSILKIA